MVDKICKFSFEKVRNFFEPIFYLFQATVQFLTPKLKILNSNKAELNLRSYISVDEIFVRKIHFLLLKFFVSKHLFEVTVLFLTLC